MIISSFIKVDFKDLKQIPYVLLTLFSFLFQHASRPYILNQVSSHLSNFLKTNYSCYRKKKCTLKTLYNIQNISKSLKLRKFVIRKLINEPLLTKRFKYQEFWAIALSITFWCIILHPSVWSHFLSKDLKLEWRLSKKIRIQSSHLALFIKAKNNFLFTFDENWIILWIRNVGWEDFFDLL